MTVAILRELELSTGYLESEPVDSIYFGGGTPSLIEPKDINTIIETLSQYHEIDKDTEYTLEANPDDLTLDRIKAYGDSPINRFSIGIQSFFNDDLEYLNRAHSSDQAYNSIENVQKAGFNRISADLIYGIPALTDKNWIHNIETLTRLGVAHLSCYSLTVEPNTALNSWIQKGRESPLDEDQSARQFGLLMDLLQQKGYEHYEISNFCLPGNYALHNSNYWKSRKYLGIGPSAHSYNGVSRQWNIANNAKYIKAISLGTIPFAREELTMEMRYNEYIMTGLRTKWGINLDQVRDRFGTKYYDFLLSGLNSLPIRKYINHTGQQIMLNRSGKFHADRIASDLFHT